MSRLLSVNKDVISWKSYFIWQAVFEILLTLIAYPNCGLGHFFPFLVFFFATGITDNLKTGWSFIKKYPEIPAALVIYLVHFGIRAPSTYLVFYFSTFVFSGYTIACNQNDDSEKSIQKLLIPLVFILLISIVSFLKRPNPLASYFPQTAIFYSSERLTSIFVHAIPASCWCFFFIVGSILFIKSGFIKTLFIMTGAAALLLTGSRWSIIVTSLFILVFILRKLIFFFLHTDGKNKKKSGVLLLLAVCLAVVFVAFGLPAVHTRLVSLLDHFKELPESVSFRYRSSVWKTVVTDLIPQGSISSILFGRGYLSTEGAVATGSYEFNQWGVMPGTVDNTFLTLTYGFGLMGGGLYLLTAIRTIRHLFAKDSTLKKLSLVVLGMILLSLVFDMENWGSVDVLLLVTYGMSLGRACEIKLKNN